jgi:hypothetical protein
MTVTLDTDPLSEIEVIVPPELPADVAVARGAEWSERSVRRLARDVVSCRSTPLAAPRALRGAVPEPA